MQNKYLIIFSSDDKFNIAAKRLETIAIKSKWFDKVLVYGLSGLFGDYIPEVIRNGFSSKYTHGCGLWAWKADFINYCINNIIEEGAIVFYLDAGFEINILGEKKFIEYCDAANKGYIVVTRTKKIEFLYNNRIVYEKVKIKRYHWLTFQYQAGFLLFKNNTINRAFVNKWHQLCLFNGCQLLTANSFLAGLIGQNRHDQSVLSALLKSTNSAYSIGIPLSGIPQLISKSQYMLTYPVFSLRNYTEHSFLTILKDVEPKDTLFSRLKYFFDRLIFKVYKS